MKKRILSFSLFLLSILFMATSCTKTTIIVSGVSSLVVGNQTTLTATLNVDGLDSSKIEFVWSSQDETVVTVDKKGVVTAHAVGETVINVSYDKYSGEFAIKVITREMANRKVLKSPEVVSEELLVGEKIEIALFEEKAGYVENRYNPYDYDQINVYAVFVSPSGKEMVMPAFWYRDYEITLNTDYTSISSVSGVASKNPDEPQGLEGVNWKQTDLHYRLRVTLDEVGEYKYYINVEEDGNLTQYIESSLTVKAPTQSNNKGIIQVDPATKRNFIDGNGETFMPVGVNLCWWTNGSRKTYDYDVWMNAMSENGLNMARIWMATWGFSLHWGKEYNNFDSRLNMAARLDKVMNLADENNIYIQLCFVNHGQFTTNPNANTEWAKNPYNTANGGIIDRPSKFFSDAECKRTFKNEIKYIIARYGYSDKIMAWELFNEVDWTDDAEGINKININKWHEEMGAYVDSIDPYNHMITTSYKTNDGPAYSSKYIDYTCPHDYGYEYKNINSNMPQAMAGIIKKYDKPTLQAEVGVDWRSGVDSAKVDPTGISIRQALWAGMLGGTAGAAMHWWWDSWIHPNNLWTVYNGASVYAKEMDMAGEMYTMLNTVSTLSNERSEIIGYQFEDRIYGYVYDYKWWFKNPDVEELSTNISIAVGSEANYVLTVYNTSTGEIINVSDVQTQYDAAKEANCIVFDMTFHEDVAFIITKK